MLPSIERVIAIATPAEPGRALVRLAAEWATIARAELDVVDGAVLRRRAPSAQELVVLPDPALGRD
ncbi:hypothetical protein L6R52_40410, partial [Myxococcota bacterium]|nr:hypothetical protein [Myxococcota bacterium]